MRLSAIEKKIHNLFKIHFKNLLINVYIRAHQSVFLDINFKNSESFWRLSKLNVYVYRLSKERKGCEIKQIQINENLI